MSFTRRQILTAAASVAALTMAPCAFAAPKSVRIAVGGKALYYLESRRIHTSLNLSEAEFLNLP